MFVCGGVFFFFFWKGDCRCDSKHITHLAPKKYKVKNSKLQEKTEKVKGGKALLHWLYTEKQETKN